MLADAGLIQTSLIWVAYACAVAFCLIAAIITTFTWQTPRERSAVVSAVAVVSLTALLATVLLLPVDIALVSATGSARLGVKKHWATPERVADILLSLKVLYYTLYSVDALLCLLLIPFAYFWYEEYDEIEFEEEGRTWRSRLWAATKYTLFFVALVVALFLIGFFVPAAGGRGGGPGKDWANLASSYLDSLVSQSNGEKALTFALGLLVTLGTLLYVVYTGAGLALMPISFIKSAPSISAPQLSATTASQLAQNRERQRQLEMRYAGRHDDSMTRKDRRELDALVREEQTLVRRERLAAEAQGEGHSRLYHAWLQVCAFFRPVKMIGGILLLLLSVLVAISMLITGIDKATHSVCKQRCGYVLDRIRVFQPINWIFVQTARVFPIDYVLMALLVLHLFSSSISGIAAVGIRFLWIRIFQIRRGRTAPQALLIATVMLGLITLAVNYAVAMFVAPQYSVFGTQTFCSLDPPAPGMSPDCRANPDKVLPCAHSLEHPFAARACTPSVMSTFLNRITTTWPFFGIVTFWGQFVFLAVFLVVLVTALFRAPRVNLTELDEDAEEDEEESLLAATGRRFAASWEDARGNISNTGNNNNNNNNNNNRNSRNYGTSHA
ncbi:putative lysosomal cobalamin transporter [Beauveria bassiana D1-5]|uniref:Probable lysosomal cobalamin transporter n=1 Tax=Beauveria bassiana D1-5 TaxID=1245745 RepID=A0A0A2VFB5_BEABA|nr:putative lysosomal cobalamin transporter [Beauveria bassiana D1-5]